MIKLKDLINERDYHLTKPPRNVAGVAVVSEGQVLCVKRSETQGNFPNFWSLPMGGVEKGETFEEAGLIVNPDDLKLLLQRSKHDFGMIYYYVTDKFTGKGVALSHEHKSFSWADWEKIEKLDTIFEPDILALIERLLSSK